MALELTPMTPVMFLMAVIVLLVCLQSTASLGPAHEHRFCFASFSGKSIVQIIRVGCPLLQIQIPRSLPTHHFGKRITKLNLLFRAFPNVSHPHVASIHWGTDRRINPSQNQI